MPISLPEGTAVEVAVQPTSSVAPVASGQPLTFYERYKEIIGVATDLPEDFAENHDHYIHGTPKR